MTKTPTPIGLIKMKQKPQTLVNLEKGRYFKSSYEYYKEWMDRYSDPPEREIPIMESWDLLHGLFDVRGSSRDILVELFLHS